MQEPQSEAVQKQRLDIPEIPPEKRFYFNGFSVTVTAADCLIILLHNDQPVGLLNTTHVVAKTFVEHFGRLIENFENKSGQTIYKLDELMEKLSEKKSP
jgi:hypothetical protein